MSSKNNINVDHYKTKGRGRQGDGVVYDEYNRLRDQLRSRSRRGLSAKRLLARKRALRAARQMESSGVKPAGIDSHEFRLGGDDYKQVSAQEN